jgi:hypothetical protein
LLKLSQSITNDCYNANEPGEIKMRKGHGRSRNVRDGSTNTFRFQLLDILRSIFEGRVFSILDGL